MRCQILAHLRMGTIVELLLPCSCPRTVEELLRRVAATTKHNQILGAAFKFNSQFLERLARQCTTADSDLSTVRWGWQSKSPSCPDAYCVLKIRQKIAYPSPPEEHMEIDASNAKQGAGANTARLQSGCWTCPASLWTGSQN